MAITNTRGKISSACPADTDEVQLYSVPAGTEIDAVLRISNIDSVPSSYSIYHCSANHGDNASIVTDTIAPDVDIDPKGSTPHEYSIHAGPTETIRVKSGSANNIIFHLSGNKKMVA